MAAKQGTLAQLSAQAEDAKRAVLSKAGASSWFSNLNTVCTIKSAPPRSPEVLQLLATKQGWLYKRNEQHVWQARWCCVVPHTFLYYFDAPAPGTLGSGTSGGTGGDGDGSPAHPSVPSAAQQEQWNAAVREGMRHVKNRKPHEKRSHLMFPAFGGVGGDGGTGTGTTSTGGLTTTAGSEVGGLDIHTAADLTGDEPALKGGANVTPAGIIDLECYSTMHRSSHNASVLELAGDDQVNPDLRAFYFCSDNPHDVEEWNFHMLHNRHSALADEVDAYKQVADGFAQQLQGLHAELDEAVIAQEQKEQELYKVRSAAEETRRTVYKTAQECWEERSLTAGECGLEQRAEFRQSMETIRGQDMGVTATVRLLADYAGVVEDTVSTLQATVAELRAQVQHSGQTDQAEIKELQQTTDRQAAAFATEREQLIQQLAVASAANEASKKELEDVQNDLGSTKMEVTMLMSQQRNKLATQQQHKKILKKEVIDLRSKVEDVVSEQSTLQHEYDKMVLQFEQERQRADLLSRYVDKMESQVSVQQNMMEMMSQAGGSVYNGGGSVYNGMGGGGGGGGSVYNGDTNRSVARSVRGNDYTPNRRGNGRNDQQNADADFDNDERMLMQPPNINSSSKYAEESSPRRSKQLSPKQAFNRDESPSRRLQQLQERLQRSPQRLQQLQHGRTSSFQLHADTNHNDFDAKSHVSELTEDRTQREFTMQFAQHMNESPSKRQQEARYRKRQQEIRQLRSPRLGPPSVIIGVKNNDDDHDLIDDDTDALFQPQLQHTTRPRNRPSDNCSNSRTLETIHSSVHSSVPSGIVQLDQPERRDSISTSLDHTEDTNSSMGSHKLSVAQRARIQADQQTTPVKARLDSKSLSSMQKRNSSASLNKQLMAATTPNPSPRNEKKSFLPRTFPSPRSQQNNIQQQSSGRSVHSQSGIWKRMEEAVLGPRSDDDSFSSDPSTRVTDHSESDNTRENGSGRFRRRRHTQEEEEKKDNASISNLSLQERSQLQRNKQLRFLKEQGLINKEADVKGGAGATDASSVASSKTSPNQACGTPQRLRRATLSPSS